MTTHLTGALAAIIADPDCCAASKAIAREALMGCQPQDISRVQPGMRYEVYKIDELAVSDRSTDSTTKPVMSELLTPVIKRLSRAVWDVRAIPNREDISIILDSFRRLSNPEPPKGVRTWYRGWETVWSGTAAQWTGEGWYACLGGEDLDCITVSALTWDGLLDEIDDHDKTDARGMIGGGA